MTNFFICAVSSAAAFLVIVFGGLFASQNTIAFKIAVFVLAGV